MKIFKEEPFLAVLFVLVMSFLVLVVGYVGYVLVHSVWDGHVVPDDAVLLGGHVVPDDPVVWGDQVVEYVGVPGVVGKGVASGRSGWDGVVGAHCQHVTGVTDVGEGVVGSHCQHITGVGGGSVNGAVNVLATQTKNVINWIDFIFSTFLFNFSLAQY